MYLYALIAAGMNSLDEKIYLYSKIEELSTFSVILRSKTKESFKFICRESLPYVIKSLGSRHIIDHEGLFKAHVLVSKSQKLAFYAFTALDYPRALAFKCLDEFCNEFEENVGEAWTKIQLDENIDIEVLPSLFKRYQNAMKFDKLYMAQKNADEVQVILHETIKQLLEQGQDVDKLVERSKDLSFESKMFYKEAKKYRRCCNLI